VREAGEEEVHLGGRVAAEVWARVQQPLHGVQHRPEDPRVHGRLLLRRLLLRQDHREERLLEAVRQLRHFIADGSIEPLHAPPEDLARALQDVLGLIEPLPADLGERVADFLCSAAGCVDEPRRPLLAHHVPMQLHDGDAAALQRRDDVEAEPARGLDAVAHEHAADDHVERVLRQHEGIGFAYDEVLVGAAQIQRLLWAR